MANPATLIGEIEIWESWFPFIFWSKRKTTLNSYGKDTLWVYTSANRVVIDTKTGRQPNPNFWFRCRIDKKELERIEKIYNENLRRDYSVRTGPEDPKPTEELATQTSV